MKVFFKYTLLVILFVFEKTKSERRIVNGKPVPGTPKRYMAYLLKAPLSPRKYNAWLCGGAIVNPQFILTSAACVEDVEYMYAVAGYEKYVPFDKIEEDECIKKMKKKVVFTCTPKMYELDYAKVEKWSNVDIAIVKVESPYNFNTLRENSGPGVCTWIPDQIEISFETKHQAPETDVMVLGWGHSSIWRKPSDAKDYNQEKLQYSPTVILNKTICKIAYQSAQAELPEIIDKYMICTLGEGNIDAEGRIINKPPGTLDGCDQAHIQDCVPKTQDTNMLSALNFMKYGYYNFMRRSDLNESVNGTNLNVTDESGTNEPSGNSNGICQNDHGGPLITWVGGREILIGVASVFLVDAKDRTCTGPYLHTSTQCNGAFLSCVLHMFDDEEAKNDTSVKDNTRRDYYQGETPQMARERRDREDINQRYRYLVKRNAEMCNLPPEERGFDMVQRRISWMQHPDGPAENEFEEDLIERPDIPLYMYS